MGCKQCLKNGNKVSGLSKMFGEQDEQFLASRRSKQSFQHEDSISHRNDDQAAKSDRERARSPSCEFPSSRRSKDLQQNDSRRVVCSPRQWSTQGHSAENRFASALSVCVVDVSFAYNCYELLQVGRT